MKIRILSVIMINQNISWLHLTAAMVVMSIPWKASWLKLKNLKRQMQM